MFGEPSCLEGMEMSLALTGSRRSNRSLRGFERAQVDFAIWMALARVICLPSSADGAKSGRRFFSQSVENLVSPWNGYSRTRNRASKNRIRSLCCNLSFLT